MAIFGTAGMSTGLLTEFGDNVCGDNCNSLSGRRLRLDKCLKSELKKSGEVKNYPNSNLNFFTGGLSEEPNDVLRVPKSIVKRFIAILISMRKLIYFREN